jgi:hypothetical protein
VTATNSGGSATVESAATAPILYWDTRLQSKPRKTTRAKSATFYWSALRNGTKLFSGFKSQCKLDKGAWVACNPGKTYRMRVGLHTFRVRAGASGVWDGTPAVYTWRVNR